MLNKTLQILWPSFLAAALGELLFFAMFDPEEMSIFGHPLGLSRLAAYSVGFFLFWGVTGCSSAMTWLVMRDESLKGDAGGADSRA